MNLVALQLVKRSPQYRLLRKRFVVTEIPWPAESWEEDGLVYFIFDLIREYGTSQFAPLAMFVVDLRVSSLMLVRLITPNAIKSEVEIETLYPSKEKQ